MRGVSGRLNVFLYYYPRVLAEFLLFGFWGLVLETLYVYFMTGAWTLRGGLAYGLPIIHIYGFGCLFLVYVLGRYRSRPVLFFTLSVGALSLVELIGSYLEQWMTGHRSWDYAGKPFNFQGRICLSTSLAWGTLAFLAVFLLYPEIRRVIARIPRKVLVYGAVILTPYVFVASFIKYLL